MKNLRLITISSAKMVINSLVSPIAWVRLIVFFTVISNSSLSAQSWAALAGGGMNDWVYATTVFNGNLIAGGKFTSAGGVSANHVASWNGSGWSALGQGLNGKVNALIVYNGNLYAGGEFTASGGTQMNFIAKWDGTSWVNDLGDMGSTVTSLAVYNNNLIAGGYFTDADGTTTNYIAQYNNNNGWMPLGAGMSGSQGQVMALTVHNGALYAGGFFTSAGGSSANHIAKWDGTTWSALSSGIDNIVYTLGEYNSTLIVGGLFLAAGGIPANHIASWNGTTWAALGSGMSGTFYQYVFALAVYNGNLIAGGYFTESDGITTNGIAEWDGTSWHAMNSGLFYPGNVFGVHTLTVFGNDLIVGGLFSSAGAEGAAHIASWSSPITGINQTYHDDSFKIFPNPANDGFSLVTEPAFGTVSEFNLYNANGQLIISENRDLITRHFNTSDLSNGMYFLELRIAGKSEIRKLIIQH